MDESPVETNGQLPDISPIILMHDALWRARCRGILHFTTCVAVPHSPNIQTKRLDYEFCTWWSTYSFSGVIGHTGTAAEGVKKRPGMPWIYTFSTVHCTHMCALFLSCVILAHVCKCVELFYGEWRFPPCFYLSGQKKKILQRVCRRVQPKRINSPIYWRYTMAFLVSDVMYGVYQCIVCIFSPANLEK